MNKLINAALIGISVLFVGFSVYTSESLLQFLYFFIEACMVVGVINGFIWITRNERWTAIGKLILFAFMLILLTHITRISWMVERGGVALEVSYFFRGDLFQHTAQVAGSSLFIGGVFGFFIWVLKQPRKRSIRILGGFFILLLTGAISFFLYINRDMTDRDIYFNYSIGTLDDVKRLAITSNKAIYVDFWHSGCGPCLEEFSNHQEFSGLIDANKVQLLFIGTDRSVPGEKAKQRVLVDKYNLAGTHTFISREAFYKLLDEAGYDDNTHGIKAFPHHMIIGENGEVIRVKAPKPSKELALYLNELNFAEVK